MNRIKRACTLLLAIVLALGAVLEPGIGGVYAENLEQTEQMDELIEDPVELIEDSSEPVVEPTGLVVESAEMVVEPTTEPATEPETEPTAEPETEPATEPATEPQTEAPALSFYEQLMACGSLADFDAQMCAAETAALSALTQEELKQLLARVEALCAGLAQPTEADALLKEELLKKLSEHIIICPECGGACGAHDEGCPAAPLFCTCGAGDGVHTEGCPLCVSNVAVCLECGEVGGHAETCSQYAAEAAKYPWAELTDSELAAWLMDEANGDTVRSILTGDGEEYIALLARIDGILEGEDSELAMQLQAYLSTLMGTDEARALAETESYIYFDLAAGNIKIGKNTYTGYVFVNGTATVVTGPHNKDNHYYVYQSNLTDESSVGYYKNTGYAKKEDFEAKRNCHVPEYQRVRNGGEQWTDFVTNNTDVKAVSNAWEAVAGACGRTGTSNNITFASESGYTADVIIDNIWSTHHTGKNARTSGGIGANLKNSKIDCTNTHIVLRLRGDNRVGCVHYSAKEGAGNQIEFNNGESGGTPGSITVADFPSTEWNQNYWSSAIGAADDPANIGDFADGIVINSGVVYAGTTSADDCTAIGGGGNNFGGVTITGGTVTAVSASTGTAIGGGIGWGSRGGDADVWISGGTVYAYNHGIGPDSGSYTSFVPAVAIGGGSADRNTGNLNTTVTITGGFVYAQSVGGAAIGGGGSGTSTGGKATVNIEGGTVIAKSIGRRVNYNKNSNKNHEEDVLAGVSIGGGTGKTRGGSVVLNVSGENTVLRTGSIGGGAVTDGSKNIGSAEVKITGGDITGQVIMAGGTNTSCSFTMSGGKIHGTNVIDGNTVTDTAFTDPQPDVKIQYLEKNGGAVWMEDPNGVTTISGGTIEDCSSYLGGAVYMEGGKFSLSGDGTIKKNKALLKDGSQGYGGGVYIRNGDAEVNGGSVCENIAQIRGGGVYLEGGNVTVSGGSIRGNTAGLERLGESLPADVGRGGGVYLEGGQFTMTNGEISGNTARYRGGGIFLRQSPTLTAGTISGNTAGNSGGGVCVNGDQLELKSTAMQIFGNEATENGGGVAVLNGSFILNGGAVGVENGAPNKAKKGGGVYVQAENDDAAASATVNSGNIWYNNAAEGGGIYLANGKGDFTLDGENATVSHNTATNGGGIYLYKNPLLNQGKIEANNADENGGGMYINDCLVTLSPANDVTITGNDAKNGAGIYIHGSSGDSGSAVNAVDAVSSASPTEKVGLLVASDFAGTVSFTNNTATASGGAVCVNAGRFQLESDKITVTGNTAVNGGGVAVLNGNFTMTAGSIGEKDGANHADNGGGVYVSNGEVWLKGGSVEYNEAVNGGGAYVTGGRIVMISGSLANNEASENGGGGYVAGNFRMLGGTVGGAGGGNRAKKGGGVYVNEGNVFVIYGEISHNHASEDGGGFHVSAADNAVRVLMLSGSLSNNQAQEKGGGMAVESTNSQEISVEIGCLLDHKVADGKPTLPIAYEGDAYKDYAVFDEKDYHHDSCPKVQYNQAGNIGGGFYMNSESSTLSFYCVEETGNTAAKGKENSEGMDVEGGRVVIGDKNYHNHAHDQGLNGDKQGVPWGYISMDNATLVNGGVVDIYGDMTNPIFRDEVTVDIKDTNDHFMDHRRAYNSEKSYKVHYIENFRETGLYQAFQYDEGNTVIEIEGALYNRPGYTILGWCTQPIRDETQPGNYYYEVGKTIDLASGKVPGMGEHSINCDICGVDKKDENLLELYAIWEANGYIVAFDPNVPQGDTCTGSMEEQEYQYGVEQELAENQYQYPGHFFKGWNTQADGQGNNYENHQKVSNLTDKNGATVVLYAQWDPCEHDVPERWSYDVIDDGKTLRRICSCGGQTLTASLYAADTVYDGKPNPATLTLDDQKAWGIDAPTVVYTGERLKKEDEDKYKELEFNKDGIPYHAGVYTASITKKNGDIPVTASVKYTIAKADQDAPAKPTYDVPDKSNNVVIDKLESNQIEDETGKTFTAEAEYRLSYYVDSVLTPTAWQKMPDGNEKLSIEMQTAWTSYNVEARFEELEDYNASDIVRADAVYHYAGDVTVKIICDEGIEPYFSADLGSDGKFNGAKLILNIKDGYYIVGGKYIIEAILQTKDADKPVGHPVQEVEGTDKEYSIQSVPDNSTLTITIGKARKIPQTETQVVPRQVFRSITGDSAIISRDSAFTAAFRISNFDPAYEKDGNSYGAYTGLNLIFDSKIPADTTIILLDRTKNGAETYWYYRAGSETDSVPLKAFTKMGERETYSIPQPAAVNGYIALKYQFIVDFSQSAGFSSGNSLTMTLEAEKKAAPTNVPDVSSGVTVTMENSGFTFAKSPDTSGLTNGFTCTFTVTEGAAASKWENRASALVLTPKTDTVLPPDACIKAEVGGGTTYLYRSGGSFIVPLSLLGTEEKTVNLTLRSTLFPPEGASYSFDAEWRISPSKAGRAPMAGDQKNEQKGKVDVTFTASSKAVPSLKSKGMDGQSRVLTNRDTLKLEIEQKALDGYAISAALLRKGENGTYVGTGWNQTEVSGTSLSVPLGGQAPGSFCLMLTVKQGIKTVMEVPYYFCIRGTQ